jgi:hypothetical protein
MRDGDSVANTGRINFLWDSLVVAIGSNTTSLKFEEVVSSLLSEEMR